MKDKILHCGNMRCGKTLAMEKILEDKKRKGEKVITPKTSNKKPLGAYKL